MVGARDRRRPGDDFDLQVGERRPDGGDQLVERGDRADADIEDVVAREIARRAQVERAADVLGVDIFERHRLLFRDPCRHAANAAFDQRVAFLAAAGTAPEMAHAEDVGGPHDGDLETVPVGIGLQDQLLRRLGVAVGGAAAEREVLFHHAVGSGSPPVVGAEGGDAEQPLDTGQPHRLADGDGGVDVEVHAEMERVLGALADQPGGVQHGVRAVLLDGRQNAGQMPRVLGDQRVAARAQAAVEIILARDGVEKHHLLAAGERANREAGADQPGTGNQRGHGTSLRVRGANAPVCVNRPCRANRPVRPPGIIA